MTRIESPRVDLKTSAERVAKDFHDWDTFGSLLGSGTVTDFQASGEKCSFKVTGGVSVHLARTTTGEWKEGDVLTFKTEAPTPVNFSLEVHIESAGDGCTCQVFCDADLNPFTKMMVEPALKGLFDQMAQTLQSKY